MEEKKDPPNHDHHHNALHWLMMNSKKKKNKRKRPPSSSSSRFVACPAGCGRHVAKEDMNLHLDRKCAQLLQPPAAAAAAASSSSSPPLDDLKADKEVRPISSSDSPTLLLLHNDEGDGLLHGPAPLARVSLESGAETGAPDHHHHLEEEKDEENGEPTSTSLILAWQTKTFLQNDHHGDHPGQQPETSTTGHDDDDTVSRVVVALADTAETAAASPEDRDKKSSSCSSSSAAAGDLFQHMMQQSKFVFATPSSSDTSTKLPSRTCTFYLTSDLKVEFGWGGLSSDHFHSARPVMWSSQVAISWRNHPLRRPDQESTAKPSSSSSSWPPLLVNLCTSLHSASPSPPPPPDHPNSSESSRFSSSSSLPTTMRLVQHHSRLSVPVLKSCLQKALRRRRPLPAVRLAMELADKSGSDLIRRLPVIVLEDSTLHPDLPLLVWLVMAHAKDYQPCNTLWTRIFQIVYEVASCRWKDALPDEPSPPPPRPSGSRMGEAEPRESTSSDPPPSPPPDPLQGLWTATWPRGSDTPGEQWHNDGPAQEAASLKQDSLHSDELEPARVSPELMWVWSMLLRAEYGGVAGDITMLHRFAQLWYQRLCHPHGPDSPQVVALDPHLLTHLTSDEAHTGPSCWRQVPHFVHASAREDSLERVGTLLASTLPSLSLHDVGLEGIDFHCSPIVQVLLAEPYLCDLCRDLLLLSSSRQDTGPPQLTDPGTAQEGPGSPPTDRSRLERIFKACLWEYSGGVNRRFPLWSPNNIPEKDGDPKMRPEDDCTSAAPPGPGPPRSTAAAWSELWYELLLPRVERYQRAYVQERLARVPKI